MARKRTRPAKLKASDSSVAAFLSTIERRDPPSSAPSFGRVLAGLGSAAVMGYGATEMYTAASRVDSGGMWVGGGFALSGAMMLIGAVVSHRHAKRPS